MLADKAAAFRQALYLALDNEFRVGQIAAAARGVRRQRADAALDVDRVVSPVGAGVAGQLIKRLLAFAKICGERAQPVGALVERQLSQGWTTELARITGHGREIEARTR